MAEKDPESSHVTAALNAMLEKEKAMLKRALKKMADGERKDEDSNDESMKKQRMGLSPQQSFQCRFCREMFSEQEKRNDHENRCHCKYPIECRLCEYTTDTLLKGRRHFKRTHPEAADQAFVCVGCGESFEAETSLRRHLVKNKTCRQSINDLELSAQDTGIEKRSYKCDYCTASFDLVWLKNRHELKLHKKQNEAKVKEATGDSLVCPNCHLIFSDLETANRHFGRSKKCFAHPKAVEIIREIKNNIKCRFCDKKFRLPEDMLHHETSNHALELASLGVTCGGCGKGFHRKNGLAIHQARAKNEFCQIFANLKD